MVVAALTTSAVTMAEPANADVVATIQSAPVDYDRVQPGCHYYAFEYNLNLPDDVRSWSVLVGTGGSAGFGEVLSDYGYAGDPADGKVSLRICNDDFDRKGRVFVPVKGDFDTADGRSGVISGQGTLQLQLARTTTRLTFGPTHSPRYNQAVSVGARVTVENEYGSQPARFSKVEVQIRAGGKWVRLPGRGFLVGGNGRDTTRYRWNVRGSQTIRLFTAAQDGFKQSASNPLTIRTRR